MAGAMSGRITATTTHYNYYFDWTITSQGLNGTTPYSVVSVAFKQVLKDGQWAFNSNATYTFSVDGTQSASGTLGFDSRNYTRNTEYTLWTKSITVNHDNTGAKTLALSFIYATGVPDAGGTVTVSGDAVLQDIPMGSKIASLRPSTVNLGDSPVSIATTITRYSNTYYHRLTYKLGNTTVATRNAGRVDSYTFSVAPEEWLPLMPNASSASGTVTLETYRDSAYSNKVGEASTVALTINCTANPFAYISVAPRGNAYNRGVSPVLFFNGQSTALIDFSGAGAEGSTVKKLELYQNGTLIRTVSNPTDIQQFTTGVLNGSSVTFKVVTTDSRGRTAQASTTVTLQSYTVPAITNASAFRCDSTGEADSSGTYLQVQATAAATGTGNRIESFVVNTETIGGGTVERNIPLTSGTAKTIGSGQYAITTSYIVEFVATDTMGYTTRVSKRIATVSRVINVLDGGNGIAFGKFAEYAGFLESGWHVRVPAIHVASSLSNYPEITFGTFAGNEMGALSGYESGTGNQMYIQVRQGSGSNINRDAYFLPEKASSDHSDRNYNILTSKNVVDVSIGSKTIAGSGYVSINNSKPAGTVLGAWVKTYGSISPVGAINVTGDGNFLFGAPNTTVTGLVVTFLVI